MRNFKIYYDMTGDKPIIGMAKVIESPDPIRALNTFHFFMQKEMERHPDTYRITKLVQIYGSRGDGGGSLIESEVDLPKSANPALVENRSVTPPAEETPEFHILNDIKSWGSLPD